MKRIIFCIFLILTVFVCASDLEITFLNIHQGDSILLSMPNGKHYLIDGGQPTYYDPVKDIYYSHFDAGKDVILPYLKAHNIKKLDGILGTHPDADHIGGLIYVINHFPVDTVYYNGKTHTTLTFKNFMKAIKDNHLKYVELRDGDVLNWDKNVLVNVIAPTENEVKYPKNNNDTSIVLYIKYVDVSCILTGDAEYGEEGRMVSDYGNNLKADILKLGHHGSKSASSPSFLKAVNPIYGIISAGKNNKFGFPHKETLLRIYNQNPKMKIVRTDYNGHISFITDGKTIKVEPQKEKIFTISEVLKQENINPESGKKDYSINVPADIKKIDINKASRKELITLPRIGPKTADNIINYRNESGPFKTIYDITNVPRIGEKTFEKLQPYIMVEGEIVAVKNSSEQNNIVNNSNNEKININTASQKELETLPRVGPKTAQNIINYRTENGPFEGETYKDNNASNKIEDLSNTSDKKKININTASQKELETLPRVGPKTAQNIINYRNEHGPFKTIHDITNVSRIGEKTFENLRPYITVANDNDKTKNEHKSIDNPAKKKNELKVEDTATDKEETITIKGGCSKDLSIKKININTASQKELEALPYVNRRKALEIINYRKENGQFKSVDEIRDAIKIKQKTLEKLRPYIVVE
jgi:competence protein ComEC